LNRQALKLELDLAKKALEARCAENEALRDGMKKLLKQLQVLQYMESADTGSSKIILTKY